MSDTELDRRPLSMDRRPLSTFGLVDLAKAIKVEHAAVVEAAKSVVPRAIRAGELLKEAKDGPNKVGHGKFTAWVEANCGFSMRRGQSYMNLFKNKDKIMAALDASGKSETVSLLSFREAVAIANDTAASSTNTSDTYDAREKKLIEKLEEMKAPEAEAAAEKTMKEMRYIVKLKQTAVKQAG